MRVKFSIALFSLIIFFGNIIKAQPGVFQPGDYKDGVYEKENAVNRRYIPYTHLREGDVTWEKRVWRTIDVREKINQQFYFPVDPNVSRVSFVQLLLKYVLNGSIMSFDDEEFMIPYEKAEIRSKLIIPGDTQVVEDFRPDGSSFDTTKVTAADSNWVNYNFCGIDIKEDWFFDKQKSSLEVRIISLGIAVKRKGKEELGCNPLFYVYFPSCRPYFAKHEVFNVKNDSERRTFEDIFWKRQFSSAVTKESNVFDRKIETYAKGLDALLESDRIKGDIFKWEHDLWHF
jgi:gliding motility associated protien GldN